MSGGFPLDLDVCNGSDAGFVLASANGTPITWTAANTKGAWVQLVAATPADTSFVLIEGNLDVRGAAIVTQAAFDIGIGAGGSEVVLAPNLYLSNPFTQSTDCCIAIPLQIPAGTRIAARAQGDSTTVFTITTKLSLYDGALTQGEGAAGVDAINLVATTTTPTAVIPGNGAFGSWIQVTAATSRDYMGVFAQYNAPAHAFYGLQFGIGAGGSEKPITGTRTALFSATNFSMGGQDVPFIPVRIPAGSRVAARAAFVTNGSGLTNLGVSLYGVHQ